MMSEETLYEKLRLISVKFRSLAHLIENQNDEFFPDDIEDIRWGLGSLLAELSTQIRDIGRKIESEELRGRKRSKK